MGKGFTQTVCAATASPSAPLSCTPTLALGSPCATASPSTIDSATRWAAPAALLAAACTACAASPTAAPTSPASTCFSCMGGPSPVACCQSRGRQRWQAPLAGAGPPPPCTHPLRPGGHPMTWQQLSHSRIAVQPASPLAQQPPGRHCRAVLKRWLPERGRRCQQGVV